MANATFGSVWNRVLLYAPDLPPPLAQEFVKNAYRLVIDEHYWSELRADKEILLPTALSAGTINVTNGSNQVVGTTTGWTSAVQYRQLAVGAIAPWYTITAIDTGTQTLTLDRNYEGIANAASSYLIGKFYAEFPTDLGVLEKVRDQQNGWYLVTHWYSQEYLDRVDAKRSSSGTPVILVSAPARVDTNGDVIPRYEFWPKVTGERFYAYRYRKTHELTSNSTRILGALHPDMLVYGALRQAALWPGTAEKPNPHFSQELHATYTKLYEESLNSSIQGDLDINQQMIQIGDDVTRRFPFDAKYLQDHIW
jgi:hypothetical protein